MVFKQLSNNKCVGGAYSAMTNYQHIQSASVEHLHSLLGGLVGVHEMKDPDAADEYLWNWLNSEVDGDIKIFIPRYCESKDRESQLIEENRKLKEDNEFLTREVTNLAAESWERAVKLAKLEKQVRASIDKYELRGSRFRGQKKAIKNGLNCRISRNYAVCPKES